MLVEKCKRFYVTVFGLILLISTVLISAGCHPKNVASMPTQKLEMPAPTSAPVNSNQKNKGENMNDSNLQPVSEGNWGATGINFVVEGDDVKIEYDCANGEIKTKLMKDANGEFQADGFHTRESFGPTRLDNPPKPKPAHYEGKVSGDKMTLVVTLTETKEKIADFTLERGKFGRLRKCQ